MTLLCPNHVSAINYEQLRYSIEVRGGIVLADWDNRKTRFATCNPRPISCGQCYTGEGQPPSAHCHRVTLWSHYAPGVHWCPLVSTQHKYRSSYITRHLFHIQLSPSEARYEWDDLTWGTFQCHVSLIWSILQYLDSRVNDILTTQWEVLMVGDLCHPDCTFTFSEQMLQLVTQNNITWLITNSQKFIVLDK